MLTVGDHIANIDQVISDNIATLSTNRPLLSQNLMAQLRNLVEAVAVRLHTGSNDAPFDFARVEPAMKYVRQRAQLNVLGRFHKFLQASSSHYTLDPVESERLMLKYYHYLQRLRELMSGVCGITILRGIDQFPLDQDQSLEEYRRRVAEAVDAAHLLPPVTEHKARHYIHSVRPFFVNGKAYYEVTFYSALNQTSNADRVIGFTDQEVGDKYAASLTLASDWVDILGFSVPVTIIREWEVSIRPCELNNFARIFGKVSTARSGSGEYRQVMNYLTESGASLIDLVELPDSAYHEFRARAVARVRRPQLFPTFDIARECLRRRIHGHNVIRYLLLHMNNEIIKTQFDTAPCPILSNLRLRFGCNPFETMPFCTSLVNHNPRLADLFEALDPSERTHELLARRIKNNVEHRGMLYTPLSELSAFGDIDPLIAQYNSQLYPGHGRRRLIRDHDQVFIQEHEDDTAEIIQRLLAHAGSGVDGYEEAVTHWLAGRPPVVIDDPSKADALRRLFVHSRVALIYGAAGTGKTTMVNYVSSYFSDQQKLYLAHTNPAVDNLRRRVSARNATFRTINSHIWRRGSDPHYDVLVIDECSTVSNADLIKVLKCTRFQLLVLVGDIYQVEAIQFGNWFSTARAFLPDSSVFELATPFRTTNENLLKLWNTVRNLEDDVSEVLTKGGYCEVLDESLFVPRADDEILLCLNYDGLYGINNINRLMQSSSLEIGVSWNASVYKIGDPILFTENERFRPLIYNNLKGTIVGIDEPTVRGGPIWFDVELDRGVTSLDVKGIDLMWLGGSRVRFRVSARGNGDDDDDKSDMIVPFQIAYAVSIHKAQGLEYESVKVVITRESQERISHNVFYTAITRARAELSVYWTPETQEAVLRRLEHRTHARDIDILAARRHLTKVPARRRRR